MKITFAIASAVLILSAGVAFAQRGGDTIPMRDGSTIVTVGGGCLVQYGARGQRINDANRCNDDDMRRADQIMSGGGSYGGGYGGGQGFGGGAPGGSWAQSCRGGGMRGDVFHADCRTADGRMNSTVLDMRNCPSNQAENRNGSLVCR
ncbi:MAG: hypothetical protein WCJ15_03905 [Alphaproteobacteria bacterium]